MSGAKKAKFYVSTDTEWRQAAGATIRRVLLEQAEDTSGNPDKIIAAVISEIIADKRPGRAITDESLLFPQTWEIVAKSGPATIASYTAVMKQACRSLAISPQKDSTRRDYKTIMSLILDGTRLMKTFG